MRSHALERMRKRQESTLCCESESGLTRKIALREDRPGGVLPYRRLMGMCRWMGSHFHNCSDYNGVAFSIELLEWGRKFSNFGGK